MGFGFIIELFQILIKGMRTDRIIQSKIGLMYLDFEL